MKVVLGKYCINLQNKQHINIQCRWKEYCLMKSSLEHPLPPRLQQFDMNLQNRTVCFKCETLISQNVLIISENSHQPLIQNYFCYKVNKQLVKVTKIRIGNQLVTLTDCLTFKKSFIQDQFHKIKNRYFQVSLPAQPKMLEKKSFLSIKMWKIIKLFFEWMNQKKPQLAATFQEILQNCKSQIQLKLAIRRNIQIRTLMIEYKQKVRFQKLNKNIYQTLQKWLKGIQQKEVEQQQVQNIQQYITKTA